MTPAPRKLGQIGRFVVLVPTSGGKAGKGCARTSSIQLRVDGCIARQFRFDLGSDTSRARALIKAKEWADKNPDWKLSL